MTYAQAHRQYRNELYAHAWAYDFARRTDRVTRWRDDALTDARDTMETLRDLRSHP